MKNIYTKSILGLATIFALFGMVGTSYAATAPIMSTSSATNVTTNSATLNGFFNDGGSAMQQVYFDYGSSPLIGTLSNLAPTPTTSSGTYSVKVTGLTPGTTYYVEAVGTNGIGMSWGAPAITFTTASVNKPVMSTTSATNITSTGATLNGFYNMQNSPGSVYFEYGTSSTNLSSNTSVVNVVANSGNYSDSISGLNPGITYYFRAVGQNSVGTSFVTTILSFTTKSSTTTNTCVINNFAPNVYSTNTSGAVVYISWNTTNCTNATLSPSGYSALNYTNYAVYPSSTTTYYLNASNSLNSDSRQFTVNVGNYNPNYNCSIDSFNSSTRKVSSGNPAYLSWNTSNCSYVTLSPIGYNATYASRYPVYPSYPSTTYTLTGSNGTSRSITINVDRNNNGGGGTCTNNCGGNTNSNRPTVNTNAVTNVTSGGAVLHGSAFGNGSPVSVWFEYGTSPNLGNATSTEYGGGATNANGYLGGLLSNQTYYYRLAARNSYGTSYGNIMSFATASNIIINNNGSNNTVINRTNNSTNNTSDNNNGNQNSSEDTNVDNNQSTNNRLSASAGSAGFSLIPHTFLGWLIWILIIIVAIILIRMLMKNEYHDRGI
ncbi:hypothetical protein IT400_03410 [Candidatus Nomurabacteria bacterium]|nr:hypothetical protein [Candidatus Nomurabacteria bacterium]